MIPQRVLLIIPPLTQINTPYPSTAYLTGFLTARGYDVWQADLGIAWNAYLQRGVLAERSSVYRHVGRRGRLWHSGCL